MKKLYFLLLFNISAWVANAQTPDDFVMTFEVNNTTGLDITAPIYGNNYTVDFGDGTVLTNLNGPPGHTYATAGIYTVIVSGDLQQIGFSNFSDANAAKLKSVEQWGSEQWNFLAFAFQNCSNMMLNATDAPDLSLGPDMSFMFAWASSLNGPINHWDVSNVTSMSGMFIGASSFNQPLNNWDVSNVTNMDAMFGGAAVFNQDLSDWDFHTNVNVNNFVGATALSTDNYDALLVRFAQLGLQNKVFSAPSMQYCDSAVRNHLINIKGWSVSGDNMAANCMIPDNTISGTFLYDENADGCDANDLPLYLAYLKASDGTKAFSTFPNSMGQYILQLNAGNYTVGPVNIPGYFNVTPPSSNVAFPGSGGSQTLDFCISANQPVEDLNIVILPVSGQTRPGFQPDYQMVVQNMGTQTFTNVTVNVTFDDTKLNFVSANPSPSPVTGNQLTFNIANLPPLVSSTIDFKMLILLPPAVNGGDQLSFTATVTPVAGDFTPSDNTFILNQTVVNAYDPNDKQVLQGSSIDIDQADEYLHYLIRFQNTGTASAIHVRLEDVLDSTLDWNTLQMLNASHSYRAEIKDDNKVDFIFENINLPDSTTDEPGSKGFIGYKIKPKANTQVGDLIIGNEVNIYFDYNLPIITNMVSTEVTEETPPPTSIEALDLNKSITLFPNPAGKAIHINAGKNIVLQSVMIYGLDGRELSSQKEDFNNIPVEQLNPGIYVIKITTNRGVINKKLIRAH